MTVTLLAAWPFFSPADAITMSLSAAGDVAASVAGHARAGEISGRADALPVVAVIRGGRPHVTPPLQAPSRSAAALLVNVAPSASMVGMQFALRAASPGDIEALLALWQEAAENDGRPPDRREALDALLARDSDAVLVAVHDGGLIGSVIAGWDGWRCHLYRLAVLPAWRRKGVASALLQAAEDRYRALGAVRIDAMVLESNGLGQEIWRARGFARQDNWRRWVKPV